MLENEKNEKNEANADARGEQNMLDKTDKMYAFSNILYFFEFDETYAKNKPIKIEWKTIPNPLPNIYDSAR